MKYSLSAFIVVALAVATNAFNEARQKQESGRYILCQNSYNCVEPCRERTQGPVDAQCLFYPPVGRLVCACIPKKYDDVKQRHVRSVDLTSSTKKPTTTTKKPTSKKPRSGTKPSTKTPTTPSTTSTVKY